jgi:hypothetical protein
MFLPPCAYHSSIRHACSVYSTSKSKTTEQGAHFLYLLYESWRVGVPILNLQLIRITLLITIHLLSHLGKYIPAMDVALKSEDLLATHFTGTRLK